MKKLMMSLVVLALFASSLVSAVDSSWIQPLTSKVEMRSYLVERSVIGYIDVWGDGVLNRSGDSIQVVGTDAVDLCEKMAVQALDLRVLNDHQDQVNLSAIMIDKDGNTTFSAWKPLSFTMSTEGELKVSDSSILLTKTDYVSVELPADVRWVSVWTRDDQGNLVGGADYQIFGRNGTLYVAVPPDVLGDDFEDGFYGELVVQRQTVGGGYEMSMYDLSTGLPLPSTDSSTSVIPSLEGVKVLAVDSDVAEVLPSVGGVGVNTFFALTVTAERSVVVRAKTSEGEVAVGVRIRALDGKMKSSEVYDFTLPVPSINLPAGRYHLWFKWSNFHENGERGPGWDYSDYGRG